MDEVYRIEPLEFQNRLSEGHILVTSDDIYRNSHFFSIGSAYPFSREIETALGIPLEGRRSVWFSQKQDKLGQGFLAIEYSKKGFLGISYSIIDYVPFDKIKFVYREDCFIATVVYGNPNGPSVQTLRQFRDDVLMSTTPGRALVRFYYSGAGKGGAYILSHHIPSIIPLIRTGLDAIVDYYDSKQRH